MGWLALPFVATERGLARQAALLSALQGRRSTDFWFAFFSDNKSCHSYLYSSVQNISCSLWQLLRFLFVTGRKECNYDVLRSVGFLNCEMHIDTDIDA